MESITLHQKYNGNDRDLSFRSRQIVDTSDTDPEIMQTNIRCNTTGGF